MYMHIILTFANHRGIECDRWMPKCEEEKPTAGQERLHQSPGCSVYTRDTNCLQPLHLCLLCFPTYCALPAPHSRRPCGSFPGGPAGSRRQGPEEGAFSVPHLPLPSPRLAQKALGTGLSGKSRHWQGWATLIPKSRGGRPSRVMPPAAGGFLPSSRRHFKKGQNWERKWKEAQALRWLYLSPSLVFLSSFCFTAPLSTGYGHLFNEILWETQQVWSMTCSYKLPDNKALLTTSGSELNSFWIKIRMLCS